MSVRPTAFHPDGSVDIWDDENGHGGTTTLAKVLFAVTEKGAEDERFLLLPCPVCDAVSMHPVSGGAAPEQVQSLHILKQVAGKKRSYTAAKARVQELSDALDGPGRFRHEKTTRGQIETEKAGKG